MDHAQALRQVVVAGSSSSASVWAGIESIDRSGVHCGADGSKAQSPGRGGRRRGFPPALGFEFGVGSDDVGAPSPEAAEPNMRALAAWYAASRSCIVMCRRWAAPGACGAGELELALEEGLVRLLPEGLVPALVLALALAWERAAREDALVSRRIMRMAGRAGGGPAPLSDMGSITLTAATAQGSRWWWRKKSQHKHCQRNCSQRSAQPLHRPSVRCRPTCNRKLGLAGQAGVARLPPHPHSTLPPPPL